MTYGGYLWTIDVDGVPNRLKATVSPNIDDYLEWIREHIIVDDDVTIAVLKLAATPNGCVYAVGRDGVVYLYVTHSDIDIRVIEETYENEVCVFIHIMSHI